MSAPTEHPAPHRHKISPSLLLWGLLLAPAAWIAQLVALYGLAGYLCAPQGMMRLATPENWPGERMVMLVLNIVCLGLALSGGAASLKAWRETRGEKSGGGHTVLEVGAGRTRFLATCGILSAACFTLAILFNTVEFFTVPACWSAGS